MDDDSLIADIEALQAYAAEADLFTAESPEATETLKRNLLDPLGTALTAYRTADQASRNAQRALLLYHYSALNKLTGNVSGRSYRDSTDPDAKLTGLVWLTFAFSLAIILYETGGNLAAAAPASDGMSTLKSLLDGKSGYVRPLLWGGLGSCIYLLKYLSDKIAAFEFDRRQLKGVEPRLALGAVLGMVVVQLFDFDSGNKVDAAAAAFLAGLGMKAIYTALESTVEALAARLNFSTLKRDTPPSSDKLSTALPEAPEVPAPATETPPQDAASVVETSQRLSLVKIIQSKLAGLGFDPGPIDGVLGGRTMGALLVCLKDATAEEIRQRGNLVGLAALLSRGAPGPDWRQQIVALKDSPLKAFEKGLPVEELAAFREGLGLLQKHGIVARDAGDPDKMTQAQLQSVVIAGIEKLAQTDSGFASLGFTEALEKLRAMP